MDDVFGTMAPRPRQPEMRSYDPSWRDRLSWAIAEALGGDKQQQQWIAGKVGGAVDFVPGVGDAVGANDAVRDWQAGNYGSAALNAGATAIGAIPGGGDAAAGIAKAIFGGIAAKTANRGTLEIAQRLAKEGADKRAIWDQTGWFKGADDKWRFEIDDSGAQLTDSAMGQMIIPGRPDYNAKMAGAFNHGALEAAYSDIGDVPYNLQRSPGAGGGRLETGEIKVYADNPKDAREISLHELQHEVQSREGFARGGSPYDNELVPIARSMQEKAVNDYAAFDAELRAYQLKHAGASAEPREYSRLVDQWKRENPEKAKLKDAAFKIGYLNPPGPQTAYRNLAGEVEARNVQTRMDMTQDQRRASPPWETQDVPDEQQIVRRR